MRSHIKLCGVFDTNANENVQDNRLGYRIQFFGFFFRVNKVGSNPGQSVSCKQGLRNRKGRKIETRTERGERKEEGKQTLKLLSTIPRAPLAPFSLEERSRAR